jgi:hypothetical protein
MSPLSCLEIFQEGFSRIICGIKNELIHSFRLISDVRILNHYWIFFRNCKASNPALIVFRFESEPSWVHAVPLNSLTNGDEDEMGFPLNGNYNFLCTPDHHKIKVRTSSGSLFERRTNERTQTANQWTTRKKSLDRAFSHLDKVLLVGRSSLVL